MNPRINSIELEQIIDQRITEALANFTAPRGNQGGIRNNNEGNVGSAKTCTYKYFMNCKQKNFYGT